MTDNYETHAANRRGRAEATERNPTEVLWTRTGSMNVPLVVLDLPAADVDGMLGCWHHPDWELGQLGEIAWETVHYSEEEQLHDIGETFSGGEPLLDCDELSAIIRLAGVKTGAVGTERPETTTVTLTFLLPDDLAVVHRIVETGHFYLTAPGETRNPRRVPCHLDWEVLYSVLREEGLWNPAMLLD